MKKLYTFLMALVALGVLSTGQLRAQYSISSYLVRQVNTPDAQNLGSGPNWNPISGTVINSGELAYYQGYMYFCSYGTALPFNVTFGALSLTTANTFTVTSTGGIILDPSWGATWLEEPYDYMYYYGEYYGVNNASNYNYAYPYSYENGLESEGSYGFYANYELDPFSGFMYNYIPEVSSNPPKFQYAVLGSAPNRELVVEADNQHAFEDFAYGYDNYGSWQTVIYENAISKFQFNYGPTFGNPFQWTQTYAGGGQTVNGWTWPGSWTESYAYNEGSWLYLEYCEGSLCGMKTTADNFILLDWNGAGWPGNQNNAPVVERNTPYGPGGTLMIDTARYLPLCSYQFFIAFPYDMTPASIVTPPSEQSEPIGLPFAPTVQLTNNGSSVATSIQMNFTITEYGVGQVYNQTLTLPTASLPASFTSKNIAFPNFTPTAYNIYEDTVIVYNSVPTDQNPGDKEVTNEWVCAPPNDIKAVQILQPTNQGTQLAVPTEIDVRFRNLGQDTQRHVPVVAVVHDQNGHVSFRDTAIIPYWPAGPHGGNSDGTQDYASSGVGPGAGAYYDTAFPAFNPVWTPSSQGNDTVFGIALMYLADGAQVNDQLSADDTTYVVTPILPAYDGEAVSVKNPQPYANEPYDINWVPAGVFKNVGIGPLLDVGVQVNISRCSDGQIVYTADTTYDELYTDEGNQIFYFPTSSPRGLYGSISQIPPGCYNECVIINANQDQDYANDTACTQFGIIDRLKGDYYVGVGQHFQTITAAVDTMRYRGIGGNVRMILTDTAYHENGNTNVSSPYGAVDLSHINGLSDTSTVTWIPYPGQSPKIYFGGKEPYGFYMGDAATFGGWMNFEGYNPSTVPTPDLLTPEPLKRQMTIIDNETNNGAAIGIEEGASNLTIKDCIIHGNGNFTSDSSAAIHMWDDHTPQTYPAVSDTVPMHNVMINNCEIGNAKYGLYDKGTHDQYNVQAGVWKVWRNFGNTFTRNTIGTAANPLSYAGIQFNDEDSITISHNEITNISNIAAGHTGLSWNVFGIESPSPATYVAGSWPGDTGNVVGAWIDANHIHIITSQGGNAYGIAVQQAATVYLTTGLTQISSTLPAVTSNRITNNEIFDLRGSGQVVPILMNTASSSYSSDRDSIFNNSITTHTATTNIMLQYQKHVFLWDNIVENIGSGPYTNYWLEVPRPYTSNISSDYNLFDLQGSNVFDSVVEYDVRYGTVFQRLYFRRLNDWRTFVGQDMHSLTGNPLFATPQQVGFDDSLAGPPATTYVESPAAYNGAWINSQGQYRDFNGNIRSQETSTPDIGADNFVGFQYTNDLAVLEISQPGGFSQTSDTSLVTTASPLWITAQVKNLSSVNIYNEPVTFTVQRSVNGSWTTIYTQNSANLTWQVGQTLSVAVPGPNLTPSNDTGVFLVTVTVPNDQNNANNTQTKAFRILLKQNAVLLSFNGYDAAGLANKTAAITALNNIGVPFDTIDRNNPKGLPNSTIIDYTPWWTIVWAMGDPSIAFTNSEPPPTGPGQGALTLTETDELTRYLNAGQTYAKKDLVIAGQNLAYYNGFVKVNNAVTDTAFIQTTMATQYILNSPISGNYAGRIVGQQPQYWKFSDSLNCPSPDLIKPSFTTAAVGSNVTGFAYTYNLHPLDASDSGAGVTHYNPTINTVFYGFDWSNPVVTTPGGAADTTSGVTRVMDGTFAFFNSHQGITLPVSFVDATVNRVSATDANALFQWQVASADNTVEYDIEQQNQNTWSQVVSVPAVSNELDYTKVQTGFDPNQTYTFRIAAVDATGTKTYSNTMELGLDATAVGFSLGQSYPNPTPGATQISFTLPEVSQVTIRILDVTGKIVNEDISNQSFDAGQQTVKLDLSALPSGSYLYEMIATGADGQSVTLSNKLTVERQ